MIDDCIRFTQFLSQWATFKYFCHFVCQSVCPFVTLFTKFVKYVCDVILSLWSRFHGFMVSWLLVKNKLRVVLKINLSSFFYNITLHWRLKTKGWFASMLRRVTLKWGKSRDKYIMCYVFWTQKLNQFLISSEKIT